MAPVGCGLGLPTDPPPEVPSGRFLFFIQFPRVLKSNSQKTTPEQKGPLLAKDDPRAKGSVGIAISTHHPTHHDEDQRRSSVPRAVSRRRVRAGPPAFVREAAALAAPLPATPAVRGSRAPSPAAAWRSAAGRPRPAAAPRPSRRRLSPVPCPPSPVPPPQRRGLPDGGAPPSPVPRPPPPPRLPSRAPSRAAAAGPSVVVRPARRLAPPLGFDPAW